MFLSKLKKEILPVTFNREGAQFINCEFDTKSTAKDQFSSDVVFITVTVEKDKVKSKLPLVVKHESASMNIRQFMCTDIQFFNEVFMYSKMLPFLQQKNIIENLFPKFYYGIGLTNNLDNNILILEDLRTFGYCLTESRTIMDFDHLALALSKLGEFHALSYAAKEKSKEEFLKMASMLKEHFCRKDNKVYQLARSCIHRAVDPLLEQEKHVEILETLLKVVDNNFLDYLLELVSPEDPLAVICHGDFCRNNMLYRYANGKPTNVKFFDVAAARCSSPVIDISLLLFLNCSKELRNAHWNDLLEIYHKSLSNTVPDTTVPSIKDIKEAITQKGMWGFIHCVFFLPTMLYGYDLNMEELSSMPLEDFVATIKSHGGAEGTKVLSDLVEELVERNVLNVPLFLKK